MEYTTDEYPFSYEEIEQPINFVTVQSMKIDNNSAREKVIPKRLDIFGYSKTKYLDDDVKISVK
jgi:hypothetical protein